MFIISYFNEYIIFRLLSIINCFTLFSGILFNQHLLNTSFIPEILLGIRNIMMIKIWILTINSSHYIEEADMGEKYRLQDNTVNAMREDIAGAT